MDGKIQIRHTVPDRILEAGSLLLTAGTTLYLLIGWDSFPERIPAHYNAAGEIDRWGSKSELIFLPVLMWVFYIGLSLLQRFPQIWNTGVKVTAANQARVYRTLKYMVVSLKLIVTADFAYMIVNITLCRPLGGWFTPVFLVLVFGDMAFWIIRLVRCR